jgi:hypothetical protein
MGQKLLALARSQRRTRHVRRGLREIEGSQIWLVN